MEILNLFWGFILTIWNVNILGQYISKVATERFILTIWNVNNLSASFL
ncbi:hypothetical protein [Clostridioides difficile]|nr:hypothetical protein [Clostridioides difficile]